MSAQTPAARYAGTAPTHHPGPPRIVPVGEAVQLAPRDPDPAGTHRWHLTDRPDESTLSLGDASVVTVTPDAVGRYRFACATPDTTHHVTVRVVPEVSHDVELTTTVAALRDARDESDPPGAVTDYYVCGPWNEWRVGEYAASQSGAAVGRTVTLPPGEHEYAIAPDSNLADAAFGTVSVPGPGRPRIRLDATADEDRIVVTATTHAGVGDDPPPSVTFELDDRDALDRADVTRTDDQLTVPVAALDGPARIHAVAVGSRGSLPATIQLTPPADDTATAASPADAVTVTHPGESPAWTADATVYEIFVRAFAGETVDTTFGELERRLPYLDSLGINCLWLTPVVGSPTTHGYHVTDYFDTAPDLGPPSAFESLVDACHERGIRVLFDLVINHTSRDHPAFQGWSAGVDEYADYYAPRQYDDPSDVDWAGEPPDYYFNWTRIPNLNHGSLAVRSWLLDVVDHWAPLVDGFRCDVAWGVPSGFWLEIRDRVRAQNADFLMLDETVPRQATVTPGFACHHDTDLYDTLRTIGAGEATADAVLDTFDDAAFAGFAPGATFLRYVENHDESRYEPAYGTAAFRAAVAATFTLPGVPMLYYGQERGVPDQRGTMRWHDGDAALTTFHRQLIACRDATPALRHGTVEAVDYEVVAGDAEQVTVFAREDGDERLLVGLNFGAESATIITPAPDATTDRVTGTDVGGEADGTVVVNDVIVVDTS